MFDLNQCDRIFILTGAGISQESGLATFRNSNGLWDQYKIEDVCTPSALKKNPALVHEFYNKRRNELKNPAVQPNAAHLALAQLQKEWHGDVTLVTQNIDNLHERAGFENVIHMHGELRKLFCQSCKAIVETDDECFPESICESCNATGTLRPDVVFFEEEPYHLGRIQKALEDADMFVSIGTSGNVYPAAGYCALARHWNISTVELNLEASKTASHFEHTLYGPATQVVPKFVNGILTHYKL
jgi:NAD-dependent deacetylase